LFHVIIYVTVGHTAVCSETGQFTVSITRESKYISSSRIKQNIINKSCRSLLVLSIDCDEFAAATTTMTKIPFCREFANCLKESHKDAQHNQIGAMFAKSV
jgi:hypothetical protein